MAHRKGRRVRLFFHKIINRITLTALLLLVQIGWLFWLFVRLSQYAVWINAALTLVSIALALYIVRREENAGYKMSWLLVLCIAPLFGLFIYLLLGNKRPSRRLRRRLEAVDQGHPRPVSAANEQTLDALPPRLRATCRYLEAYAHAPLFADTAVRYFPLGDELYSALLADLEAAQRYIFLEYFIIAEGEMLDGILDVLYRKAAEGVDVRIIYDDLGCEAATPLSFVWEAEKHGVRTLAFNPIVPLVSIVMNHRDHRKIAVIDGKIAYTGGINIADEYINKKERFGHWKDTGVRLEGHAAHGFAVMFLNLWNGLRPTETDYAPYLTPSSHQVSDEEMPLAVQPYTDSPLDDENVAETVYLDILAQAEHYVYIFTPYLIIDGEMQSALCCAAKRGVDVRIVVPGIPDKRIAFRLTRSYYGVLMQAGVHIYEYTPGFLHAKSFVADDRVGVVGSVNLDYRSLYLHFECGVLFVGGRAIAELKRDCLETMSRSHEVVRRELSRPKRLWHRLLDAILRAVSPLF